MQPNDCLTVTSQLQGINCGKAGRETGWTSCNNGLLYGSDSRKWRTPCHANLVLLTFGKAQMSSEGVMRPGDAAPSLIAPVLRGKYV